MTRRLKAGQASVGEAKQAKYTYFSAIMRAKSAHWNKFAANVNRNQIWAAACLKKPRDTDRLPSFPLATTLTNLNAALIGHFIPPKARPSLSTPRYHAATAPISVEEVSRALSKSSDKSTPRPDQILYRFWKRIHCINPLLIPG